MIRLTEKFGELNVLRKFTETGDSVITQNYFVVDKLVAEPFFLGTAVNKLSALEDVLEEFDIESAEELRERLGIDNRQD